MHEHPNQTDIIPNSENISLKISFSIITIHTHSPEQTVIIDVDSNIINNRWLPNNPKQVLARCMMKTTVVDSICGCIYVDIRVMSGFLSVSAVRCCELTCSLCEIDSIDVCSVCMFVRTQQSYNLFLQRTHIIGTRHNIVGLLSLTSSNQNELRFVAVTTNKLELVRMQATKHTRCDHLSAMLLNAGYATEICIQRSGRNERSRTTVTVSSRGSTELERRTDNRTNGPHTRNTTTHWRSTSFLN